MNYLLSIASLLLLAPAAQAQLEWDVTESELHPGLTETESISVFPFVNTGDKPVTIQAIKPSCGCTATQLAKLTYQPGEQGQVSAVFTFGRRQGYQEKNIVITTDSSTTETTLKLKVHLPEIVEMKPLFVWWQRGEEKTPKEIQFKVLHNEPFHILKTASRDERLRAEVKEVEKGRLYTIVVTPTSTDTALRTLIDIETDFDIEAKKSFRAFSHIR